MKQATKGLILPILITMLCLFAGGASAQNMPVTLKLTAEPLEKAMEQIEKQTNYLFVYDKSIDVTRKVTISVEKAPLKSVLDQLFKSTNIDYAVENNSIVLSAKKPAAQSDRISGTVVDPSGMPLIGVAVVVKGTSIGTTTDLDGKFSLRIPEGGNTLVLTYIGFENIELPIGTQTQFNITMKESSVAMDEVVVTALGIKRAEKALSYNVQKVANDEILAVKDANFVNALSGKIAGVTINSSSSGVGGASKVVMRGAKGIEQSSNALYVIDGIPMYNMKGEGSTEFGSAGSTEAIADLNPEDIESTTVLTGAAAAALYGSEGANGAIVITTKKGKAGFTNVTVSSQTQLLTSFITPKFQNRYGTGVGGVNTFGSDKSWGSALNSANNMGYSPTSDYFETGVVATESVSLSTGTDRNQTYLSAAAVNSWGMIPNNDYERYNFTFRNTTSFFKDKMTLDLGGSYIRQKDQNMTNQGIYSNPLVSAYLFPRGDDWNDIKMFERYNAERSIMTQYWPQGLNEFSGQNPYWINYRNLRNNDKNRYMFNASLSYEVTDWLSVAGRIRIDNSVTDYTEKFYASSNTTLTEGSDNGLYGINRSKERQTYGDVFVNINKTFGEFSLQANVGASISDLQFNELENRGPIDNEDGLANKFTIMHLDKNVTKKKEGGWRDQTQSVFASVELGYKNAYYLTFTGRNDWPSQLAGKNSVQSSFFYPSVGGSVILSEIIRMPQQITFLKVRSSYASVGLPFKRFLANPNYSWNEDIFNWDQATLIMYENMKPERTNSFEVGVTAKFLKHFNLDASYYNTKTFNQTFDPQVSVSAGYTKLMVQTGSVRNRGVELALGYSNNWRHWRWDSNFTFSHNKNEILELAENLILPGTGELVTKERLDIGGLSKARFVLKKGGSLGDLYSLVDLQRDSDGNIYVDANGNVSVVNANDIKLGSVFPKANMAWKNDLGYKNFSFNFMFSARVGGVVYSATQAAMDLYGVSDRSAAARDNGGVFVNGRDKVSAEKWFTTIGSQAGVPQFYTYSATNVRLQEVSLGYTIPKKHLGNLLDITVSLVGRNLWMIYNKAPFDPEAVASTGNYYQGIDYFMMPSTRNIGFNVRLKF